MKASSESRDLTANCQGTTKTITDILVGEVWHASGQSNMAGTVNPPHYENHPRGKEALAAAQTPLIRYYCAIMHPSGIPQDDLKKELELHPEKGSSFKPWQPATPESYNSFSAIALFFAKELHAELNVPIGIIATPKGGAMIEMFVPAETYKELPSYRDGQLERSAGKDKLDAYGVTTIYNSRIHPLLGYGLAGMIWYQGESNTRSDAADYSEKLSLFVHALRERWGQGDFPFYYVQLCAHGAGLEYNDIGWPIVQDQMRIALNRIPNSGMAITIDVNGHHPLNKLDGGERLAAWALANTYNKSIPYCGPLYKKHTVAGNKVTVCFDHSGSRLMLCEKEGLDLPSELPDEQSKMFELAGADGKWHPAEATLVGTTVELSSASVANPLHVRYAFRESLEGPRVYNSDGFPMSTFTSKLLDSDFEAKEYYDKNIKQDRTMKKRERNRTNGERKQNKRT
jgi:sialate O-acetylesterase